MLSFPVLPMKATMGSVPAHDGAPEPGGDPTWAYEIKWDGHRTLAHITDGTLRFQSTAGHDVTQRWSDVIGLAEAIGADAILDGEMVVIGDDGRPSFDLVQGRTDTGRHPAIFQAFDVLRIDDHDATALSYIDRRALLTQLLDPGPNWQVAAHHIGGGADLRDATLEQGLEGIMAKRLDSTYQPGTRSKDWIKIKNRRRVELPVGGFTTGTGNRATTFGSLLVGIDLEAVKDPEVARAVEGLAATNLRFAGGVGTGFNQSTLELLTTELRALSTNTCPFDPPPPAAIAHTTTWVTPSLRIVVDLAEFTNQGHVRHASFVRVVA